MSWTLFFVSAGAIAVVSSDDWIARIVVFLFLVVPLAIWTKRRIKRAAASK